MPSPSGPRQPMWPAPPAQQRYQQSKRNPIIFGSTELTMFWPCSVTSGSGSQNQWIGPQIPQRPTSVANNNEYFNNPGYNPHFGYRPVSSSSTTRSTTPKTSTSVSEPQRNMDFFGNPAYGNTPAATTKTSTRVTVGKMNNEFFNNPAYGLQPTAHPLPSRSSTSLTHPTTQIPIGQRNPDVVNMPNYGIQLNSPSPPQREYSPPHNFAPGAAPVQQNRVMFGQQNYGNRPHFQLPISQSQQMPRYQVNGQNFYGPMYANQPHRPPLSPSTRSSSSSTEATTTQNTDFFNNPAYGNILVQRKPPEGANSQWNQPNFSNLEGRGQVGNFVPYTNLVTNTKQFQFCQKI